MAKLILSSDKNVIEDIPIEKDCLTIGRLEENDIHIDSMAISSRHAKIVTMEEDAFLEDLGSTNGTFVNATQITKCALNDGDLITIGTHSLKYVRNLATDEAEQTENVVGNNGTHATSVLASLQVMNGDDSGKDIPISKKMTTLGKPGEHIAAITQRSGGFYFVHVDGGDEDSESMLNGEPVAGKGEQLKDHDVIEVAGVKMEFVTH